MTATIQTAPTRQRLPFIVPLLAVGTFLMSTTENIIAGLLQPMAADLHVSEARVGLLITGFAAGMIVGGPAMAALTVRIPRRSTLVAALLVFAAAHVVMALSGSFEVILAARVVAALATGAFWSVASAVATSAVGPERSSRALGIIMSGVGLAIVAGVPLGALVGQAIGWRGAFWSLAILAVLAAAVVRVCAPADVAEDAPPLARQLRSLGQTRLWILVAATIFITGGYTTAFNIVSPLLTDRAGLPGWAVPLVLIGFGVGAIVGTNLGGRLGDRIPVRSMIGSAVGCIVVMALLVPLSTNALAAVVLVALLGVFGLSAPPVVTGLAVRLTSSAPSLGAAISVAGFNLGIAIGSWFGGVALESTLGPVGPPLVGSTMAVVSLVPLAAMAVASAKSASTGERSDGRVQHA